MKLFCGGPEALSTAQDDWQAFGYQFKPSAFVKPTKLFDLVKTDGGSVCSAFRRIHDRDIQLRRDRCFRRERLQ